MKAILFAVGGLILGGLLGNVLWVFAQFILQPLLVVLLAGGGAYIAYQYAKREEIGGIGNDNDWQA